MGGTCVSTAEWKASLSSVDPIGVWKSLAGVGSSLGRALTILSFLLDSAADGGEALRFDSLDFGGGGGGGVSNAAAAASAACLSAF